MEFAENPIESLIEIIARECKEAGASEWDTARVVKSLTKSNLISLDSLRSKAIIELNKVNPRAADVYNVFHRLNVYTSDIEIQGFDRGNIIKSLLKETTITRSLAKQISSEVENKIKDLDLIYITTSMIRELVNERLLSYGYYNIRKQYKRVGLPIFEVKKILKSTPIEFDPLMEEYTLSKSLPKKISNLIYSRKLFVPNLPQFGSKAYSKSLSCPNNLIDLQRAVLENSIIFSAPITLERVNFNFENILSEKERLNTLEKALFAIKPVLTQNPNFTLSLYTNSKESIKQKTLAIKFAKLLFNSKLDSEFVFEIDSRYEINLLKKSWKGKKTVLNSSSETMNYFSNKVSSTSKILIQPFYLNCFNFYSKESFFEKIEKAFELIKIASQIKLKELEQKTYMKDSIEKIKKGKFFVGLCTTENILKNSSNKEEFLNKLISLSKKTLGKDFDIGICQNKKALEFFKNKKPLKLEIPKEVCNQLTGLVITNKENVSNYLEKGAKLVEFN